MSHQVMIETVDDLKTELEETKERLAFVEAENDEMLAKIEDADIALEMLAQKDRVLAIALRALDVTERELLMVENSVRPKEVLLSMVA